MHPPCAGALETEQPNNAAAQVTWLQPCSAMPQAEALFREPHRRGCNMLRHKPAFLWGAALCRGALQPQRTGAALAGTAADIAWPRHAWQLLEPACCCHTSPFKSCFPETVLTSGRTSCGTVVFNKGFYNINIDFDTVKTCSSLIPTL